MISVRVVQRPAHRVVDVVPVGNGDVTAGGAVGLSALHRSADARPSAIHLEAVLVGVPAVRGVQVAVVQVVFVIAMAHGPMAAVRAMLVLVAIVRGAGHGYAPRAILAPRR